MYSSLIDAKTLDNDLASEDFIIVDCRYDLQNKTAGRDAYLESHIVGAVYADLHDDLSGPPITNKGRHPLLTQEGHQHLFSQLGISPGQQVIAYDASGGAFAARLWWMLHYLGHQAVAVLDGGWQAWLAIDGAVASGPMQNQATDFVGTVNEHAVFQVDDVLASAHLVDSREPSRYRGEVEPIDPVAGHIPGAINRFFKDNLTEDGLFKDKVILQGDMDRFTTGVPIEEVVFYCGSGVTACHNILACYHAFDKMPRLYAGSWSEWCSDATRPVETSLE